ncbi:MAG: MBL fold metallo-hydrolase [Pseudomonadales bacterium]|nr:MBL fold metallo-hydrolase [Pseudomonadales bacterium]
MLTSPTRSFLTNAYLIETESAVVAIDTFMLVSDAQALCALFDSIALPSGKPLLGIIITHGHPDHYNGTSTLIAGLKDVPVISSQGITDCIKNSVDAKQVKWKPFFGDDWPEHKILPNQWVADGTSLTLDGLQYHFRDWGAAESSSDLSITLGQQRSVVFVGDVVFNTMHGFMNDGHTQQWLAVLKQLAVELADVPLLFTGHGAPGKTAPLIAKQIQYLQTYRHHVSKLAGTAYALTSEQKICLEKILCNAYPDYQLKGFIQDGADAVAAEISEYNNQGLPP